MTSSAVAIFIPVFNQPQLAAECLESLQRQTYQDFQITLVDDAGVADYQPVIDRFSKSMTLHYQRNAKNLGALRNMEACLQAPCAQLYKLVFHEDDGMHPTFLQRQVELLDKHPAAVFCATDMTLEKDGFALPAQSDVRRCRSKADLLRIFIGPYNFTFGSALYRTSRIKPAAFDLERFSTLADRPYLLNQLQGDEALFINEPLVYYRPHAPATDQRADSLQLEHLLALYDYYQGIIESQSPVDEQLRKEFIHFVTNSSLSGGLPLARKSRYSAWEFIRRLHQKHIFSPGAIGAAGLKGALRFMGSAL